MRTHVPVGFGLFEVVFQLIGVARKMTTTVGLSFTGVPTGATCTALYTVWGVQWRPRLPTAYTFAGARLYVGDGTPNPPHFDDATVVAGTNPNTLLFPASLVHVVDKKTALAGRRGRGRMYIPGAKEGDAGNGGVIGAATLATYDASLLLVKNGMEAVANVGNLYLLGHDPGFAPVQITELKMRAKLGSQVRRLRDA